MRIARRSAVALVAALFLVSISSQLTWASGKSGALDPTFGAGGKVLTHFGPPEGSETADDLAIQSDGKIVAAGNFSPGNETGDFALARYNLDGTLDPTFNGTGQVLTDFGGCGTVCGSTDGAFALAIQSDGKIVAAGDSDASESGSSDFALARYNPDGTPDPTFNATGKVLTDFGGPGSRDSALALAIQSDGKIVAAGVASSEASFEFALARYNPDGTLDPTFNGTGKVVTDFGGPESGDVAGGLAIQPDGKIVVAGVSASLATGRSDFALARYNPDGTLDPTFNGTGQVLTDFGGSGVRDSADALAIQSDGKIVAAGSSDASGTYDVALARYNPDGTLDPTFNGTGKVLTDFSKSGSNEGASDMAIQSDGKIVTAGSFSASGTSSSDFALARYTSRGRLDRRFGANGKVLTDFGGPADFAYALAIQLDGKIVAAGGYEYKLARYLP